MIRRTRSSSGPIGEDRSGGGGGSGPRPVKEIDRSRELDDGSIVQEAGDRPGPPEPAATPGEAGLQGAPDFDTIVGRYGEIRTGVVVEDVAPSILGYLHAEER